MANVKRENREFQRTITAIHESDPDVLMLLEPDQMWIDEMKTFANAYPYAVSEGRDDNFGILVMSKRPLVDAKIERLGDAQVPTVVASIELNKQVVTVIGTHPYPPFSAENTRLRDDQLLRIGTYIHQLPNPTLLVGDFNATPFSSIISQLESEANLRNCAEGHGLNRTWQRSWLLPPIPLAIDHCFATPEVKIQSFEVGPKVGSDHRPIIVRFSL